MLFKKIKVAILFAVASVATIPVTVAELPFYSQDFETLVQVDPTALSADGWLVFYNVYDGDDGLFLFGHGPFQAPNDGGAFAAIDTGQGGIDQGAQQLRVFSDYNNTSSHAMGDLVEANIFQQWTIGEANAGDTWIFRFDARRGDIGGATTALAFIRTFDPANGFALTNFITLNMTGVSSNWSTFELNIDIDSNLVGQLLQIGFANTATNFEPSAIFYDNVTMRTPIDSDSDGVEDIFDNCQFEVNSDQRDSNNDGCGNVCDPDIDNNGIVNFLDVGEFALQFGSTDGGDADTNGDGNVNFLDYPIYPAYFLQAPGPGVTECVIADKKKSQKKY